MLGRVDFTSHDFFFLFRIAFFERIECVAYDLFSIVRGLNDLYHKLMQKSEDVIQGCKHQLRMYS